MRVRAEVPDQPAACRVGWQAAEIERVEGRRQVRFNEWRRDRVWFRLLGDHPAITPAAKLLITLLPAQFRGQLPVLEVLHPGVAVFQEVLGAWVRECPD